MHDQVRGKMQQIFRYLKELNSLRNPVTTEIDDQPWTMWLRDIPAHPCVRRGQVTKTTDGAEPEVDDFVLRVRRPALTPAPEPPPELEPWLEGSWQDLNGTVTVRATRHTIAPDGSAVEERFDANKARVALCERWRAAHTAWEEAERPTRQVLAVYERLFDLRARLQREGERLDLVVGDGILYWRVGDAVTLRHPVLLQRLQLQFDPTIPEFTLLDTDRAPELYTAMLRLVDQVEPGALTHGREDLERGHWHPLGGDQTTGFLQRFVAELSHNGQVLPIRTARTDWDQPVIVRDPVLFLRPRTLGYATAIEGVLDDLDKRQDFPRALTRVVGIEGKQPADSYLAPDLIENPNGEDEHVLLSKPANREQLQIAQRLDSHGAVLVQGPPGTGKTHTIANLLGHLLAQGKTVLVTSQTAKALRVLRAQVVEPLQPLCVSVIDDTSDQMESAIDGIVERLDAEANDLEREASVAHQRRQDVLRQLREARSQLRQARLDEFVSVTVAGDSYRPADAARLVAEGCGRHDWIPGPITLGEPLPLSPAELTALYASNVLEPDPELEYRPDLWRPAEGSGAPDLLHAMAQELPQALEPLTGGDRWRLAAIEAGREGGPALQAWLDLITQIEEVCKQAREFVPISMQAEIVVPPDCLPDRIDAVLTELCEHTGRGRGLGFWHSWRHRAWKIVMERCQYGGRKPMASNEFLALRLAVRLQAARNALVERWQRQMAQVGAPDALAMGSEPEQQMRQFVEPLRGCLDWYGTTWSPVEGRLAALGCSWEVLLAEVPFDIGPHGALLRLRTAAQELPRILAAEAKRRSRAADLRHREELLTRLEPVAPAWADAIRTRRGPHGLVELPGDVAAAWRWRQLHDELERRSLLSMEQLQSRIQELSAHLHRVTARLVEQRAWAEQLRRTSLPQRMALMGWKATIKQAGKRTGKRAPKLLAKARELMPVCQTAVPVWIMPLSRVVENFDPRTNRFDVVIIDEASQADAMALIALYMGEQVVVVGDDEQVSPTPIGLKAEDVDRLNTEHLQGIPLSHMWGAELSIYQLARVSFQPVQLREHFRCVAPIIQFSNHLAYGGHIKPLRDASDVPQRPYTVAYRVPPESGGTYPEEAEAWTVASLLVAACEQREYANATFGVIAMARDEQAQRIDALLHKHMDPVQYDRRKVQCGSPAEFQGDERDVMFLSMVDANTGEGKLSLKGEGAGDMFKKRFNVAASRARNQMWVVHSLDPACDLKEGDIRRRLIEHAQNPNAAAVQLAQQEPRVESEFERQVLCRLTAAGYRVHVQWPAGAYRIDMVVEGGGRRLAVECDGDRYHTLDDLPADMARQAILERLGWRFVRIRGSQFFRDPDAAMAAVFARLRQLEIPPEGAAATTASEADVDGLKERIIARAAELRRAWRERAEEGAPAASRRRSGRVTRVVAEPAAARGRRKAGEKR